MSVQSERRLSLKVCNAPSAADALTNCVFLHADDASVLTLAVQAVALPLQTYVLIRDIVYVFRASDAVPRGCVGMSSVQRRNTQLALGDAVVAVAHNPTDERFVLTTLRLEVDLLSKPRAPPAAGAGQTTSAPAAAAAAATAAGPTFSAVQLCAAIERQFVRHFFTVGQVVLLQVDDVNLTLHVKSLEVSDMASVVAQAEQKHQQQQQQQQTPGEVEVLPPPEEPISGRGVLLKNTEIKLERMAGSALRLTGGESSGSGIGLFRTRNLSPETLGVGGLDREFMDIVRRTLASRIFPPALLERLGVTHVKGMLLYGPPGTGKTLMARTISKMLNGKEPLIKSGPELFNKYVGQTEENIRNLFKDAMDEYQQRGDDSDLHVIVLDEIDALCKTRGSRGDGTGVGDSAVNQLLAMIDGVNALNNILVIGMTNRKDMIDEALLRPGRLEVHIEVGLPDEAGRLQIFRIHTAAMSKSGHLTSDVDLRALARQTKNFTGADIAGLVKSAVSFALASKIDFENLREPPKPEEISVTREHFQRAITEVKPAFGIDEADFTRCFSNGVFVYGNGFQRVVDVMNTLIGQTRESSRTPLVSVLVSGRSGCGKTALAAKLAVQSGFPFVKIVSPDDLVRFGSEASRCAHIVQAFEDSYKSPLSIIIIDDIERLLDYVPLGPRFSNAVLQTLLVLVKKPPPKAGRKLMVIGTTSQPGVLREMGIFEAFNAAVEIPPITGPDELRIVLSALRAGGPGITSEVIDGACAAFPPDAEIPVKRLIMLVEMARQYRDPLRQGGLLSSLRLAATSSDIDRDRDRYTFGSAAAAPPQQQQSPIAVAVAAANALPGSTPAAGEDASPEPTMDRPH